MKLNGLIFLVLAALAVPAAAEEDCRLQLAASLPIEAKHPWRIIIPAQVEGKPVRLIVDTGSGHSALSQAAADRLGIKPDIIAGLRPYLPYAGGQAKYYAKTKDFTLGTMTAPKALFFIMPVDMPEADGLIGADFLRHFDVEFDFAGHKMNLFAPHRCPGQVVYWTSEGGVGVPFHTASTDSSGRVSMMDPHIRLDMTLDGQTVPAILDTGAPHTGINLMQAKVLFHLDENAPGVEAAGKESYRYRFKSLTLGGIAVENPEVLIHTTDRARSLDTNALLGMSILRKLHLYIAYEAHMLYVTPADAH